MCADNRRCALRSEVISAIGLSWSFSSLAYRNLSPLFHSGVKEYAKERQDRYSHKRSNPPFTLHRLYINLRRRANDCSVVQMAKEDVDQTQLARGRKWMEEGYRVSRLDCERKKQGGGQHPAAVWKKGIFRRHRRYLITASLGETIANVQKREPCERNLKYSRLYLQFILCPSLMCPVVGVVVTYRGLKKARRLIMKLLDVCAVCLTRIANRF